MEPPRTPILIAAAVGPLSEALQALLLSLPWVDSLHVVQDPAGVLAALPSASPDTLVILVIEAGQTWISTVVTIRQVAPSARIAILAGDAGQVMAESIQRHHLVDLVLQQGTWPETLIAELELLVSGEGKGGLST